MKDIIDMLRDHADNEERYIHPLFVAAGVDVAEELEAAHVELERGLAALAAVVDEGRWASLYSAATKFIGVYLLHIDAEERAQAEHLWTRLGDAELAAVMARFKAERSPTAARSDLKLLLPALSDVELSSLLGGMRAGMAAPAFTATLDVARTVLGAARVDAIVAAK